MLPAYLTADEIVQFTVGRFCPTSNGDGPLQAKIGNIRDDALESDLIAASWI
jgi:hypothetical protein